jgi:hypothetical protein
VEAVVVNGDAAMVEVGRYNGGDGGLVKIQNREMLRRWKTKDI